MKNVLLPRQAKVLAQLACGRTLLAFDFDGTLAPIVSSRESAGMRAPTRALFEKLCELFPTAVISGRGRGDVTERLGGAAVKYVVGNHGLERGQDSHALTMLLNEARVRLNALVASTPGLELEDKGFSITVHYRRTKRPAAAQAAIKRVLSRLTAPLRAIGGKSVVNVLPRNGRHKGDALVGLCEQEGAHLALYVGDDLTDEDVFELHQPGRPICIRVGRSVKSAASYFLSSQREIDVLLRRLIALKTGAAQQGAGRHRAAAAHRAPLQAAR